MLSWLSDATALKQWLRATTRGRVALVQTSTAPERSFAMATPRAINVPQSNANPNAIVARWKQIKAGGAQASARQGPFDLTMSAPGGNAAGGFPSTTGGGGDLLGGSGFDAPTGQSSGLGDTSGFGDLESQRTGQSSGLGDTSGFGDFGESAAPQASGDLFGGGDMFGSTPAPAATSGSDLLGGDLLGGGGFDA
eukprot:CAMPEP_0175987154 /NCGR_PEP_ID=MMETSP0108-20121206/50553_1 /TAXON_ID=195067 ORGANISM="Goniomonas pacifica, Strain CCMP1869" /NCGR_SAMPLE_ID=MMETSP0108 /ASSEMBLY_ACC=CAM_ASM_000204 /LENGTH=193 /DNA_ID=CAMNT_0017318403 /DNA_START=1 /DNA_END=580 /DNA_ORIENTATION=-